MSAIPPPSLLSVVQTAAAQRAQSARDDVESNRAPFAARELTRIDARLDDSVDDAGVQSNVNTEDGGQGSAGRWTDDAAPDAAPDGLTSADAQPDKTDGIDILI